MSQASPLPMSHSRSTTDTHQHGRERKPCCSCPSSSASAASHRSRGRGAATAPLYNSVSSVVSRSGAAQPARHPSIEHLARPGTHKQPWWWRRQRAGTWAPCWWARRRRSFDWPTRSQDSAKSSPKPSVTDCTKITLKNQTCKNASRCQSNLCDSHVRQNCKREQLPSSELVLLRRKFKTTI